MSHAILEWNAPGRHDTRADGIVITPSHNPPKDGGFKYNPPSGGPADTAVTSAIQRRANALLAGSVRALPLGEALARSAEFDFITPYVEQLNEVIDMEAIAREGCTSALTR